MQANFYHLKTNQAKVGCIIDIAMHAIDTAQKLLIVVSSAEAAQYIENALWSFRHESFLPSIITNQPNTNGIVITTQQQTNLNNAHNLLNLCQSISPLYTQVKVIHEIYDLSNDQRKQSSQTRLDFYISQNITIEHSSNYA